MKLVYIASLEHSGSTLVNHLLTRHPQVIGVGEVASFFSPKTRSNHMAKWGNAPTSNMCSCGATFPECPFWHDLYPLNGQDSDLPMPDKYARLIEHTRSRHPECGWLVDSSKSTKTLNMILSNHEHIGLRPQDIFVVLLTRDCRGFAASIAAKRGSLISHLRTFNWWVGAQNRFLDILKQKQVSHHCVHYEKLCASPQQVVDDMLVACGAGVPDGSASPMERSHIAMGNTGFKFRTREGIRYDSRWMRDDRISLAYLLHWPARRLNHRLYETDRVIVSPGKQRNVE